MNDLISRQAAIDVIDAVFPVDPMKSEYAQGIACGAALAIEYVKQLPSAQPEHLVKESGDLVNDCISRQAAIDAIMGEPTDAHYPSWYAERLEQLPSAHHNQRKTDC